MTKAQKVELREIEAAIREREAVGGPFGEEYEHLVSTWCHAVLAENRQVQESVRARRVRELEDTN